MFSFCLTASRRSVVSSAAGVARILPISSSLAGHSTSLKSIEERSACSNVAAPAPYQATPASSVNAAGRRGLHSSAHPSASVASRMAMRSVDKTERVKASKGDPFFREVWRKFQLKVHPDLFAKYPELQKANSESLQKLQGILNECKSGSKCMTEILQPRTESLEFYLRTDKDNAFMRVPLTVRIPAGDCRNVLAASFATLFKQANLPTRFHWGPEYWQSTYTLPKAAPGEDDD